MAARICDEPRRGEAGTTLAELLVVVLLLGVVGAVTTTGIVRGFNAQLASTNVAETLDGTRLATQRVRDFARGADEVCASSTDVSLVLWTDDDDDGEVDDGELDVFELVEAAPGEDIFRRRVPLLGGDDEVQLIRDDIINSALFVYDVPPGDQPAEIECLDGASVSDGSTRTRSVDVTFTVQNPNDGDPDLTTSTSVQLRNAGLERAPETAPTADFTHNCPAGTQQCDFNGTLSGDLDGSVVAWEWDFGDDSGVVTGDVVSHTYAVGDEDYDVTLTVTDDDGETDTFTKTVRPGLSDGSNARPLASFTVDCLGLICEFDASGSSDDSGIAAYEWSFGDGNTGSGETVTHDYGASNSYVVTLTVTDDDATDPKTDSVAKSVTASTKAMRVESLSGVGSAPSGNPSRWTASITIDLSLTTTGHPGEGIVVSGTAVSSSSEDVVCSTDSNGRCTITVSGINSTKELKFTVTQVNDPEDEYEYDEDQNKATAIIIYDSQTTTSP